MDDLIVLIPYLISEIIFASVVGALIGRLRGRAGLGCLLGFLLGPLGWVITLLCADARPRCRECRGVVPADARKCLHCGTDLYAKPKAFRSALDNCPFCGALVTTGINASRCGSCGTAF